jgi:hypothetical protein
METLNREIHQLTFQHFFLTNELLCLNKGKKFLSEWVNTLKKLPTSKTTIILFLLLELGQYKLIKIFG